MALLTHDDATKWEYFPPYWSFMRGIPRSAVNSPHRGHWRGALMLPLICAWINGWVNTRAAGDLRRHRSVTNGCHREPPWYFHYDKRIYIYSFISIYLYIHIYGLYWSHRYKSMISIKNMISIYNSLIIDIYHACQKHVSFIQNDV